MRSWALLCCFVLWSLGGLAWAGGNYRPAIAVLSFQSPKDLQKDTQTLRQEIVSLLETDERLQVFSSDLFEKTAKEYGYLPPDLFEGDGIDIVSRDTEYDGVLVGKVQKLGTKFELVLKVFDGGTGLGLLTTTLTIPRLQLRQGEKEQILEEVGGALAEARLKVAPIETPKEPTPKAPPKESRRAKKKREREEAALAAKKAEENKAPKKDPKEEPKDGSTPNEDPKEPDSEVSNGLPPEKDPEEPKPKKPKPEKDPKPGTNEALAYGKVSISAGPAVLGRFSAIQAVDANGVPLANFEPTLYAAPAYGGVNVRGSLAPFELFTKEVRDPYLIAEGSFARSFGLASNLDGQSIATQAQEISVGASLRVALGKPVLALRGQFTIYDFQFLPNEEQIAAGLETQLQTLGLINLKYQVLGFGPELQLPLGKASRLLLVGADFNAVIDAGQAALDGYGLLERSSGVQGKVGTRMRLNGGLLVEAAAFGRLWNVDYEGGGTLLEGETVQTQDKLFGVLVSAGYTTK